ncbi:hypothetical protein H0H81_012745 [Sphagnurus paluster]|uniref:Uncharacterized protein n=1 Tax=Sphagnurus paluster TaxID=117069 RepID=A0A9P7FTS8_9AGAR|nr:hypothetical protein H0H81_012745 [Sphagnurus paluster]
MNKLKDGKYQIINRASGNKVGLTPLTQASTATPSPGRHTTSSITSSHALRFVFTLTHKKDDSYELKIEGNSVIGKNGGVFAPPKGGEQLWKIVYREGNKAYTIEMEEKNEHVGWVLGGQDLQVKLMVLPMTKSKPPQFFSTDIWHFEHVGK